MRLQLIQQRHAQVLQNIVKYYTTLEIFPNTVSYYGKELYFLDVY